MPRNENGQYSLPLPAVKPNDLITAEWANSTTGDLGNAITDSLDRNGLGGMKAPMRFVDGTSAKPGAAFNNDTGTGVYRTDTNVMGLSVAGKAVSEVSGNGISMMNNTKVFVQAAPAGATEVTNKQYVDTTINNAVADAVKKIGIVGEIRMFAPGVGLPAGWHICDGNNGTPNLLDRFIIAAGSRFAAGNAGGSTIITTAQMPSHAHGGSVSGTTAEANANHTHGFDVMTGGMDRAAEHSHGVSDPGHRHQYPNGVGSVPSLNGDGKYSVNTFTDPAATGIGIAATNTDHLHHVAGNTGGFSNNHAHGFSAGIPAEGGGQEYFQPFYALVFAMYTGA